MNTTTGTAENLVNLPGPDERFKDGDDGSGSELQNVRISKVENGYVVEYLYDSGEDLTEVYYTIDEVLEAVRSEFGTD